MTQTNTKPKTAILESLEQLNSGELSAKVAPHNIQAEQELLGALLINNEACDRVSSFLESKHFFDPLHQRIFDTINKLVLHGKQATPVTLKTFFENEEPLDELTVPQYLARLAASATSLINVTDYGRTIYEMALRRNLINIGSDLVNDAYETTVDHPPERQIEDAEQKLYDLAETGKYGAGFDPFSKAIADAIEMAGNAYERDGSLSGLGTGLADLDARMGGLQHSDLIILAGRPSMGKTALATNLAFNIAKAYKSLPQSDGTQKVVDGAVVGFFSLEMSSEQLATRIIAEQTEISSGKIRRGMISEDEFRRLVEASKQLNDLPLYIDDTGGISIAQLAARARRLKRQKNLGLIIVDYLQLLNGSKRAGEGRVSEVTEITTSLKALAKELEVPILALSQLSRQVENREDKRPQLSDLRESGSIEQDADVVMFVYREEYYIERAKPSESDGQKMTEWQDKMDQLHGRAEVIIGKQRHGPVGTVELAFNGEITRFSDLAHNERLPERFE